MKASAGTNDSFGRTACHGRAVVRMSSSVAAASAITHASGDGRELVRDAPVARDPRDDLDEDDGGEREAERETENGPAATPHAGAV